MARSKAVLRWTPQGPKDTIKKFIVVGMGQVTQALRSEIQRRVSRTQPTRVAQPSGRRYGLDPSLPLEDPKMVEGDYRKSIFGKVEADAKTVKGWVGSNEIKAARLEMGFEGTDAAGRRVDQAPRPAIRRTLYENRETVVKSLLKGKWQGK